MACLLGMGAAVVGGAEPARAIANGTDAAEGQYPFATKLTMTGIPDGKGGRRNSSCSGGLIAPNWILTAGHCFKNAKGVHVARPVAKKTTATVGRVDLTSDASGQVANVIAVKQSKVADVALAKLDRKITGIAPMRLNRKAPKVGTTVRLTGFGLLHGDDEEVTDHMQVGQFTITSVTDYELGMAGKSPKRSTSPCEHDSGGPYFVPDKTSAVVYGVVSYGPTCPHTGPDRSGRIDTVVSWVLDNIGRDGPVPTPKPVVVKTSAPPVALPPPPAAESGSLPSLPVMAGTAGAGMIGIVLLVRLATRRQRSRHRRR